MFIHIPLWEHRFMWFSSVDDISAAAHERAVQKHQLLAKEMKMNAQDLLTVVCFLRF